MIESFPTPNSQQIVTASVSRVRFADSAVQDQRIFFRKKKKRGQQNSSIIVAYGSLEIIIVLVP